MNNSKTTLYLVLAFIAGAVLMGLIDANASKPLFSSASPELCREHQLQSVDPKGRCYVPPSTPSSPEVPTSESLK